MVVCFVNFNVCVLFKLMGINIDLFFVMICWNNLRLEVRIFCRVIDMFLVDFLNIVMMCGFLLKFLILYFIYLKVSC